MNYSLRTMNFLDFLFPKRCVSCGKFGSYICSGCFSKIEFIEKPICPVCERQAIGGKTHPGCLGRYTLDGLIVACRYRGPIKAAIRSFKYRFVYDLCGLLVSVLVSGMWKFDVPQNAILVPVPLHTRRKNWRGFNQSEILARYLSKQFRVQFRNALQRIVETKTQVGLPKQDRQTNVLNAFVLQKGLNVTGKNIVLIDDVFTSGATMGECARVLKRSGAQSVWGVAVALG